MMSVLGSTQEEHFVMQRRRSILLDYLIATSTHGLRSVGRAYSTCNRVIWIITFIIACSLMIFFIVTSVLQYLSYPTQTNVEIVYSPKMAFPAVTVCSGTPYRFDRMNASVVDFFYRLYPPTATFDATKLQLLSLPLLVDLANRNETGQLVSLGYQLSDILLQCTYNGINCSDAFTASLSSLYANCFTFNWKTSNKFFTLSDFGTTLVTKEGLMMTFYIPRESYFSVTGFDIGLTVLLHGNDELPVPNENGLDLQPGLSHLLTYQKSTTNFLPSPYTECQSVVREDLKALYRTTFMDETASTVAAYSESVCRELCEQAYIFNKCSCIFPIPFMTRNVLTLEGTLVFANCCSPLTQDFSCALSAKQQFSASDELQTKWCSKCPGQCTHTTFNSYLSAQAAPSASDKAIWTAMLQNKTNATSILVPSDFLQRFDYYFDRNYLKLLVTCGSKYVTEYNQEARLTVGDVFSAIGGQTGLWIGLSVLSVIELSEFVYRLLYKSITQWAGRRKNQIATGTIAVNN